MFAGQNSNRVIPPDQSLTMATAVANGFDRLEKLFSKKKFGSIRKGSQKHRPSISTEPPPEPTQGQAASEPAQVQERLADEYSIFPQPSFIRPKASRMVARDETSPVSSKAGLRSKSLPDPRKIGRSLSAGSAKRHSTPDHFPSSSSSGSIGNDRNSTGNTTAPQIPYRSSSLVNYSRGERPSLASLLHYEFTDRESRNAERSLFTLYSLRPNSPAQDGTPGAQQEVVPEGLLPAFPVPPRAGRMPASEQEESNNPVTQSNTTMNFGVRLPQGPLCEPTPGPSPKPQAVPDLLFQSTRSSIDTNSDQTMRLDEMARRASLHYLHSAARGDDKSREDVYSNVPAVTDPVLLEPALGEFLGLSDDDIAESRPPSPDMPSPTEGTFESGSVRPTTAETASSVPPPRTPESSRRRSSGISGKGDGPSLSSVSARNYDVEPTSPPPATVPPSPQQIQRNSTHMSTASTDDRAAAVAAFEVARIASRYSFDLIYVISLWPRRMASRRNRPSPWYTAAPAGDVDVLGSLAAPPSLFSAPISAGLPSSSASSSARTSRRFSRWSSDANTSTVTTGFDTTAVSSVGEQQQHSTSYNTIATATTTTTIGTDTLLGAETAAAEEGLNYRFLAAYGLHLVKPPLNISYGVHSKILRNAGWIEYREPNPKENEFARGYACSFYTGYAPVEEDLLLSSGANSSRRPSVVDDDSGGSGGLCSSGADPLPADRSRNNRGIVFAAYRKPRADGVAPAMGREELREMQRDAEALVDMILDFHMVKRRGEQLEMLARKDEDGEEAVDRKSSSRRPRTAAV